MADLGSGLTGWVVFDGDRLAITGLLVTGVFLLLVALGYAGVIDLRNQDAVRGVAGGFVPGLIAFLSIVLGINQLVLSQEFGSAGEIRERIESVRDYRHEVEDLADTGPSPVLPVAFLSFVVETMQREATALEASVEADDLAVDADVREAIRSFAGTVGDEAADARTTLSGLRPGRINALLPVLEYDDSRQLYEARRLERVHADAMPAETRQALERLIEAIELFSVARTQFRTTYTQRVLARLSRQLLYVGIPALVAVVVLGLLTTAEASVLTGPARPAVVSALFALALSPLLLLAAYLLRVAAVSERTIAAGPFVSRPNASDERRNRTQGITRSTPSADPSDVAIDGEDGEGQ